MKTSLPVIIGVILVLGLGSVVLLYAGRLIKFRESIPFFDWPPADEMMNRVGLTNWIGTGIVIEGYITLLAFMLLISMALLDLTKAFSTTFYVWVAAFVLWLLVVAAGTRHYTK